MPRETGPRIVTANDLLDGEVVYLTRAGKWTRHHQEAHVAVSAEQANTMLEVARSDAGRVVGAYLADVVVSEDGVPSPVHFREAFRARGPSNYFHGKQADRRSL